MQDPHLAALCADVAQLVARRQIEQAIHNYMRGQDRLLPALQRSAFHADAQVDCGLFKGNAQAFVDFAQGWLAGCESTQHLLGQLDLHIDGQRARGEVYFIAQHRVREDGQPMDLLIAGRYQDEYEDRGSGWRISRRTEIVDWGRRDPASDGFIQAQPGLHLAARGARG